MICELLDISRQYLYSSYKPRVKDEQELIETIKTEFFKNRRAYGARKMRHHLERKGIKIGRKRLRRIMRENGLVSCYTKTKFRHKATEPNNSTVGNILNRNFKTLRPYQAVVTDLTYVDINGKWYYICLIVDLFNRQIIGHSCGPHKTAGLILQAFNSIKVKLSCIQIFHSDRGKEFDNIILDKLLSIYGIVRSLSRKGNPYDNAVIESTNKALKAEFIYQHKFESLEHLRNELYGYVFWWNNQRVHGSIGYKTPVEYLNEYLGNPQTKTHLGTPFLIA